MLIVNYPLLYPMGGCYIILLILHELSSKLSFTLSHGWMLYYTIDMNTNDNNNNIVTNISLSLSLSLSIYLSIYLSISLSLALKDIIPLSWFYIIWCVLLVFIVVYCLVVVVFFLCFKDIEESRLHIMCIYIYMYTHMCIYIYI